MRGGQIGLLLWKNYIVRKRRPAILGLVFLWPVAVFLLLYTIRDNVDVEYNPTCQFPARLMPQDGLLPFVQSYICSVGNPCESLNDYEEVPAYEHSTLGPLMMELQTVMTNETILSAVKTLPKSIKLLKSMAQILTKPEIKKLFDRGIRLGDLFDNHRTIKSLLKIHLPEAKDSMIDGLLNASVKLYYLIETFGSSNVDGVICSPESLKKYLIVSTDEELVTISKVLCNVDSSKIPDILEHLTQHLDFAGLLEMASRASAKFQKYNFNDDLVRAVKTVLDLNTVKKYVPPELKLEEWLPNVIALFKDVSFKEIDVSLINKTVDELNPIFADDRDWPIARHGLLKLNSLLIMVKDLTTKKNTGQSKESPFELIKSLTGNWKKIPAGLNDYEDVTRVLDAAYLVLKDGVKLTNRIVDRHKDDMKIAAEVLDGLREMFPQKVMNILTYLVSITENIVRVVHHVAIIHEEIAERLHNVSVIHEEVVKKMLTSMVPESYRTVVRSLSRLDFVERLVEQVHKKEPEELLCQENVLEEMFEGYKDFKENPTIVRDLLCSESGKAFVAAVYDSFEFHNFKNSIDDTLSTFITMALGQPVSIQKSNLTSFLTSTKDLMTYLENVSTKKPDWSSFRASEKWRQVFKDTRIQTRIDVLGIHLTIAKSLGSRSLSYFTIKPDLEYMDFVADMILLDLREHPTSWIGQVRQHESELVEAFYLTVTDRAKTLKILEYANFTRSYCTDKNPPDLVNYPERSNATLLKALVCRMARSAEVNLNFNVTEFEAQEKMVRERPSFNWTAFNGKAMEIYEYIETLLPQVDENYDEDRLTDLKRNFGKAWTDDLPLRDAWEISVGSLSKILDILESPVFKVKTIPSWHALYPIARAASLLTDTVERVVDHIRQANGTAKLSEVLRDLPQTEILMDVVLRNLAPMTLDVVDMLTVKVPVHYISAIKDYMSKEIYWPCIFNQSMGTVFELRDGSREVVREIERLACNPGPFVKEWKEHAVLSQVQKYFEKDFIDDPASNPPFNWTRGYVKFRVLVEKLDFLINSSEDVAIADDKGVLIYTKVSLPEIGKIIEDSLPSVESQSKTLLDYVDLEIDKNVNALRSDRTAAEVWTAIGKKHNFDDILVLAKFATRLVHDFARFFLDTLRPDSSSISLINMLGFTNETSVSLIYDRLPYIFAMMINGMSDPALDSRAYNETTSQNKPVNCSTIFAWFSDYRIGITVEEYTTLKNLSCDDNSEHFNAFTDIFVSLNNAWHKPVSDYRSYFFTLVGELFELGVTVNDFANSGFVVDLPFTTEYFEYFLTTLKNVLMIQPSSTTVSNHYANSSWWTYRLMIEGFAEVLNHAVHALKDVNRNNDVLHTWDFVESGDVRQLIKLLEAHPNEAIAMASTLATINSTTNEFIPINDLRQEMCSHHFHSKYWSERSETRFFKELCTFDIHQLIRSATSPEFHKAVVNQSPILRRVEPLSRSLVKFIDTLMNLRGPSGNHKSLVSNVINVTTWNHLPKEISDFVHQAQKSWVHKIGFAGLSTYTSESPPHDLTRFMQWGEMFGFLLDLSAGGDVWTKWKSRYDDPRSKALFAVIEDLPNISVTIIDTFASSERLTDFVQRFLAGTVQGCDIDKYLIPPVYIRRKGFLSSIGDFCQKVVLANDKVGPHRHLLLDFPRTSKSWIKSDSQTRPGQHEKFAGVMNETRVVLELERIESYLVHLVSDHVKPLEIPSWWTSFEAGTYVEFSKQYKEKDPRPLAHTIVAKSAKVLQDILETSPLAKNCSWCNSFIVQIFNSQLSHHQIYSNLICEINRLNYSQVHEIIDKNLNWNKTINMIKGYEYFSKRTNLKLFVSTIESSLNYVADMIIDYQRPTNGRNLTECFLKAIGASKNSGTGFYVKVLIGLVDWLQKNVHILDTVLNHDSIANLTRMAENFVPIWKPLREVVKSSDVDLATQLLPNASIDVNLLLSRRHGSPCGKVKDCTHPNGLEIFLNSKRAKKFLRYDPKTSNYPSTSNISRLLAKSLDFAGIADAIGSWRLEASGNFVWLREMLRHLNVVLEEGGGLMNVASRIDFDDVANTLGVPDVADGIINLVNEKTIDKLFAGLKEILDDVEPFVEDEEVRRDLRVMVEAFENMEIFKNLGLLDMKYVISEMFLDWNTLRHFLVDTIKIPDDVATILSRARLDMFSIFMKERNAISLKDTVCSTERLEGMLSFDDSETSPEEISTALCKLDDAATQNVTIALIQNLNFDYIFSNLMSANVKNILKNANLTETDGQEVFDSIGVAAELVPLFRDKLSSGFSFGGNSENSESSGKTSSGKLLQDASTMLCGKALITESGQFYRVISSISDNRKSIDQKELESLPTEFCRDTYKSVLGMSGGKIVWSYVKPLIRGKILYAPNTTAIKRVMTLANESFSQMEMFGELMNGFENSLRSLASLSEMGQSLSDLKAIMASKVMKIAIKSMSGGRLQGDFSDFDLGDIAWKIKKSSKLTDMVGMLNDFMDCVLINRLEGFATEEEMEAEAKRLTDTNEFLAGVVFLENFESSGRSTRSLDNLLPDNVVYKIRMDVDYVPSTKRVKTQFWLPGPEGNFLEDLRYLRGFIQLQDSIDRAIIKDKSGSLYNWKTVTQQMPYPCWKYTPFASTLYEAQGMQICFFFALMMCVGSAVRYFVWERESQNALVMSVMGLKPWRNTLAWFVTTYIEMTIVMVSICIVLVAGKILPRSDPTLILFLLLDYVFSIVTFCYMISTFFSSASLAAVTTVIMFLLTYIPYIIVIAMEASMTLGWKLLICLSMSTSFSYGCLYTVRREVQGIGLTWDAMWDEASPGDPMSLGLVLLSIAVDGFIYAVIGYCVTRYTNSGRDFRGLRSRSLWWAETRSLYERPSYLAFVNSLYFTNDVLHPSAAYQDEDSDPGSMIVNEKQIGVRFEAVRKIFTGAKGEFVAVDDFSLKLCEGEVTSLLGRNGAGKTTIIKMLTGMLAPTSGEIYLNGDEGTKPDIGVCPQDNVLIDTLTPREHMIFYARLKRPADDAAMLKNVNSMLTSLELGRQEHEPVCRLSGGTKRRLCVALAFLGSPKLVILDEPGAGVDPAARRRIWRLIDQHRVDRTVLLSTHHLDEADMLSDTVVVMHRGKILCTGSPLSLKTTYGYGYWLHVEFPIRETSIDRKSLENLRFMVENVVPSAKMNETSDTELVITLPFQGKHGEANDISAVAKVLEENKKILGYNHISLECDTLERVFLDLCSRADTGAPSPVQVSMDSLASIGSIGFTMPPNDIDLIIDEPPPNPRPMRQMKALIKKRLWHFARDWQAPLVTLVLPTIFVAVAMGFSLVRPPSGDEPPLLLNPTLYDTHPTYFYSIDNGSDPFLRHVSLQLHNRFGGDYAGAWQTHPNDSGTCECTEGQQICHGVSRAEEGLFQTLPGRPTLDWIVSTFHEYIEKRYGGWSLSHAGEDPLFIVWYNNKGHHSLPSYLNALNEAILKASGSQGRIKTINHPLKLSSEQLNRTSILQHVADVGVALVLLVAFSLVAAQGARELVRERLSEEKRILYLAGVHPVTYWTTALIWDFTVFLVSIVLAVIVFEIFGLSTYVARDNLAGVCILLVLFGWAAIPFTHIAEKLFDDATLSNMVLFCLNTFVGVACLATILVIDILGKSQTTRDIRNFLHHMLLLFPQYAFGDALVEITKNDITAELLEKFQMDTYKSPLGWDLIGLHYVLLFVVGVVLYFANLVIECGLLPDWPRGRIPYEKIDEDDDVVRERIRVENVGNNDVIKTVRLRKEYRSVYGTNVAVQNLSVGVQAGSCFGLLGVNGAGKSSTFRMLTTETRATAGQIILKGREIGRRPLGNGEVGYCPQTDALDGFLSPHQCLTIHGEICGLADIPKTVESMLKRFDLLKYAHQRVNSLSGGNRRKLCAAISVMAPVSVVLMDEPTSGMDPASKELVARAIRLVNRNQGCVVMTSHSASECEKLCTRVGILAKAGLRCIGTVQHLKHKFGEGYVAFLRFGQPISAGDLREAISRHLPSSLISSRQGMAARLLVPRVHEATLSSIFTKVRQLAEELKATDYTLTQSSLDQVLVNFSEELEDDAVDPRYGHRSRAVPNTYTNMMDTIHMDTF